MAKNRLVELFIRIVWGLLLLFVPGALVRAMGGTNEVASRRVMRVLGGRHLLEGAVEALHGRRVRRAGAFVDAIHAGTALTFGAVDRRWRRPALIDAMAASGFATVGWRSTRT